MRRLWQFTFFVTALFASTSISVAQAEQKPRPKVGLVLAGGGALGFAHVGVLRVLEAHRIPVDLITGTSMGSIVGAAYASGVTLDEMEKLLQETDWEGLFSESAERRQQPFRFKAGRNREIYGDVKIGLRNGSVVMPTGVVQGQNVLPLLQRLYQRTKNPTSFDELPLPFRAVTANLETGEAVIPKGGDLATIVRASMSVPGFFAPIELDNQLLVDGGIVNNLPIDVAFELGADVLIVVELYADLKKRDELGSPIAASGQIISLLLAQNSALQRKLMRPKDVLIAPNLAGFGSTDFARGVDIKARGEEAANAVLSKLQALSLSESDYEAYQARRTSGTSNVLPRTIEVVRIENESKFPDHRIREQLEFKDGEPFDREKIEAGVRRLYSTGQFQEVTYSVHESTSGDVVTVRLKEKPYLKQYVRLGATFEDDFEGESNYRLGGAYRFTDFDISGTYVDVNGEVGRSPRATIEWYQPLGSDTPFFLSPVAALGRNDLRLAEDGEDVAIYQRTTGVVSLFGGRELGSIGEIRAGVRRGFGDLERDVGDPTLPEFGYDIGEAVFGVDFDALNAPDFPTSGFSARLGTLSSAEELGASDDFNSIVGGMQLPYTFGPNTIALRGEFTYTLEDRPAERSLSLGGFLDVPGYQQGGIIASDYGLAQVLYYRRFSETKSPLFGYSLFAGGAVNFLSLQSDLRDVPDNRDLWSGLLFVGADTPLLPTYIGVGHAESGESAIYLVLGRLGIPER